MPRILIHFSGRQLRQAAHENPYSNKADTWGDHLVRIDPTESDLALIVMCDDDCGPAAAGHEHPCSAWRPPNFHMNLHVDVLEKKS